MSVLLDSYPMAVGDTVHDVVMGVGIVSNIGSDFAEVRFNNRTLTYRDGCTSNLYGRKTLYWHNPVITIPPRNAGRWSFMRAICLSVANTVLDYKGNEYDG